MRSLFYLVLAVFAAVAAAQSANPFNIPPGGYSFKVGSPTHLSWKPTTKGTVTLVLQWGQQIRPQTGISIAAHVPNSGSFTWTPQSTLVDRSDYTVEIFDDSTGQYNFLPRFSITGLSNAATTTAMTTSTAPQTTSAVSTTTAATTTGTSETTTTTGMTTTTKASSSSSAMTTEASTSATSTSTKTKGTSKTTSSTAGPSSTVPSVNGGMVNRASTGFLALAMAVVAAM